MFGSEERMLLRSLDIVNQRMRLRDMYPKTIKYAKFSATPFQGIRSRTPVKRRVKVDGAPPSTRPSFYELVFSSKLESAKRFRDWVFTLVLPSIRKYGQYKLFDNPRNKMIMIGNETSLHYQIIKVILRFCPHALLIAGLGELQDTSSKRLHAYRKGYQRGQADIVIGNKHVSFQGFAIEVKNPNNHYQISEAQLNMEQIYKLNGYKYLCSNDYDFIIKEIHDYMTGARLSCNYCNKKFKHLNSLNNHYKYFHKITG